MKKIAVILFNLGGPDNQEAVEPFLRNLFSDPRIIRVPSLIRYFLARFIAYRRAPTAKEIYHQMGGGSPILPNTKAQARALERELTEYGNIKTFIAMRYWHPRCKEMITELNNFSPDEIILLPLYPQFSTTTTESSLVEYWDELKKHGNQNIKTCATKTICCYPQEAGFITAMVQAIQTAYTAAAQHGQPRILFSAHGLPEKIIQAGDPYQWQCEQTAKAIVAALKIPQLDWINCYQSRVGPLQWITPATDAEIERAGHDKVPIVLVPIAFVSEHSETLVELDIEYRDLAIKNNVPSYHRVATVSTAPDFIKALAGLVRQALDSNTNLICPNGKRLCPGNFKTCPNKVQEK